jgi:ligand-binding sensor domain-containing protein
VLAGTWTTYTDARFISGLDVEGTYLWAGTNGGVLRWDLIAESYQKLTVTEGLVDHRVKDVLVDTEGNKWFGTTQGVQKYDGATWITYDTSNSPLPNNLVFALTQDHGGAIWMGTAFGCARFDGDTWEVFTDLGGGATNVAVRGIGIDSLNRIWTANNPDDYGSPGGVSMYDGAVWTRYDPDPSSIGQYYLSLTVDDDDNVWAGSWTNWVFRYDGAVWTHFDSNNSGLVGQNIEAFTVDESGGVWIANHTPSASTTTNGIAKFDGTTWTSYTTANSGLPFSFVYALAAMGGTLYCGTAAHGIAGFDGSTWDYYETQNDPHSNWITSIAQGTVGGSTALHYGTDHAGVAQFDGADWSSYTAENSGLGDNYINDVHVSDGVLWMGSQFSGVWSYDGISWHNYNSDNSGMLGDIVLSVATDSQGDLWLGTAGWDGPMGQDGAVARYDGVTWTNYYLSNSGLIDDDGLQVSVDQTDTVWIGTEEGVSKFDGVSTWTNYNSGNSGLIEDHVQAIAFSTTGDTWFATLGGVSRFDGATWTSYTTADGLPSNTIRDIAVSGDVVWVATAAGAASFLASSGWTAYTPADGIADENVTAVCIENADTVWFGTYRSGISAFVDPTTGVEIPLDQVAGCYLHQCFPNPFNPSTTISYDLHEPARVSLSVFDVSGRLMRRLVAGASMSAGNHQVTWDGMNATGGLAASGVYFYRLDTGSHSETRRMLLVK